MTRKTTTQLSLLIAVAANVAAFGLLAYAYPAHADDRRPATPAHWAEMLTGDRSAEFAADYMEAKEKCKGDNACITEELAKKGWK